MKRKKKFIFSHSFYPSSSPLPDRARAMMKEFLGNSYLFGANAPFIEALYDRYLEDPHAVEPRWRSYFDELQRLDDGPPDVSHEDVQQRFIDLGKSRPQARARRPVTTQVSEKQFGVLQLITAISHAGPAPGRNVDPLGRAGEGVHRRARARVLRPDRSRHGHGVQHRHAGVEARGDAARDPRVPERHLLRHHRRRIHVHDRHAAEALGAGAPGNHPRDAGVRR